MPSQSPNGASVSAAASGAVCQWQTSSTDRRGSGDRPLGNVPPGRSGPKGGAKYVRRKKFAQSLVSPPPLGGAGAQWAPALDRAGRRECPRRGRRGPTPSCPRAEDRKMALLGSNPHKTWVFEQCHVALFVEIALLLYFKLLKQTPSENRFLWFELCHFPLNCAMWHCSQSRINTGFFANSAKFSSQAVGRREGRSLLGEIDKF